MAIVLVGAGVMGESILAGVLDSGAAVSEVLVVERRADRAAEIASRFGVTVSDPSTAAAAASMLLLAVKPQDVDATLDEIGPRLSPDAVVVCLAAGVSTARVQRHLPAGVAVVRAMPNTPAVVRAGVTAISPGRNATAEHLDRAERLLGGVGVVVRVAEDQMDAVTAVSGSGPAYLFLVVEALVEAGVRVGLSRPLATELVVQTLRGSALMIDQTGEHPAVLRERVTSPGGTTAAALHALERAGVRAAFGDAVLAALDRAHQLDDLG